MNIETFINKYLSDKAHKGESAETTAIRLLAEAFNIKHEREIIFSVTIYYNHGLGNKVKETSLKAMNVKEAQAAAEKMADELIGERKWIETRIRPVGFAE